MKGQIDEIMRLAAACDIRRRSPASHLAAAWCSQAPRDAGGWAEPHPDVLFPVMSRLPFLDDRLDLATVSRSWYSAVRRSLPCSLPMLCLALPDGRFFAFQPGSSVLKPHTSRPSSSSRGSYRCATDGQLLFLTDNGGAYYNIVNPFTGRERLLPVPSGIHIQEEEAVGEPEGYWSEEMPVRKLVVFPDGALVAAILGHERAAKFALCKPEEAWSWSLNVCDPWHWYADMAVFDGKLYALTNDEDLFAMEVGYDNKSGEPRISHTERVVDGGGCRYTLKEYTRMRYLVVRPRDGGLLMVCKVMMEYATTTYEFLVFQADLKLSRWVEVDTLGGDDALFIGRLCSRAVRAARHRVHGDQIFFLDDSAGTEGSRYRLCDAFANVYDMKDGSVRELLPTQPCGHGGSAVPATWIFREDADADE